MKYSTVSIKELTTEFRIDSEYYSPENLKKEAVVKKKPFKPLQKVCNLIAGPFGSAIKTEHYDLLSDHRYIRGKDVLAFFIQDSDPVFLDKDHFQNFPQFHLKPKDILITVVGMKFGLAAIVFENDCPSLFSCKSTLLRTTDINPFFLVTYLSSKYGYGLLRRGQRGAAQPGINLFDIKNIPVPNISNEFQSIIENLIVDAKKQLQIADEIFSETETLLLEALDLSEWQSPHQLSFTSTLNKITLFNRIDAEYYQPLYEDLSNLIRSLPLGAKSLDEIITLRDKNFIPEDDVEYRYIELSNITKNGEVSGSTKALGADLPSRARRFVKKGDVIVSSIEGSIDSIALISEIDCGSLCSNGFYVFSSDTINPETLLVVMKSKIGQLQLKKGCNGTILTAISKEELKKIMLPVISDKLQCEIKAQITRMYTSKNNSKSLLEIAKRGVEIAIEEDVASAQTWIEQQVQKLET